MKIAVIGSGPASAGACLGLLNGDQKVDIDVIDIGRKLTAQTGTYFTTANQAQWYRDTHNIVHDKSKGWTPEKSYFGNVPDKYNEQLNIYKSDIFGGLSKFWGASFLPFTPEDFETWPLSYKTMEPFYHKILNEVGVTGTKDTLDSYFPGKLYNQRPIKTPKNFDKLEKAIQRQNSEFVVGSPRLALINNSNDYQNSCTNCGKCFYGCYNDSIYSSDQTIQRLIEQKLINYRPKTKLINYKQTNHKVELQLENSSITETYDAVLLGAGCIETTRIVSKSNELENIQIPIIENPVYSVPIFFTKDFFKKDDFQNIIALNNLLIGQLPNAMNPHYIHAQVYPINKYLWNHALRKGFGSLAMNLSSIFQKTISKNVYMMLIYLNGKYSEGSYLRFSSDKDEFHFIRSKESDLLVSNMIENLNQVLKGSGFWISKKLLSPLASGGSYHYSSTFPLNSKGSGIEVSSDGQISDNVFLIDSSTFPSLPAQNHSFTIMANAYRIANKLVNK